ncbi:tyrosine-protein kinase Btk-like isoform X1 [Haliotis cracherodii]|uniref:tyrosine-protein kinase Btk-like isoform X1 n=1 Tax=Haliotis cracherodii TaxID=6455 RepID=UPI0039E96762
MAHRESSCNILKIDYLMKRSQNKNTFTSENYKGRHFVLDEYYLRYFDGKLEKRGKEKGCIALPNVRAVENVENRMLDNRDNVFQVMYHENSDFFTLYIVALNADQRDTWVTAIRQQAQKQGANFVPKYHKGVWTKTLRKYNCCDQLYRNAPGCEVATHEQQENVMPVQQQRQQQQVSVNGASKKEAKVYVAIYDYQPAEEGDLELACGEEYEILDDSREHWWQAKDKKGNQGYIPANYVKRKFDLEIYDWYYKDITRQRSEAILQEDNREGCFLVRDSSSTPGMYTLSLFTNEGSVLVRHYHIRKDSEGKFYISDKHAYPSIPDVVHYHKHNSGGLVCRLREPPRRHSAPSTAGFGHGKWEIDPDDLETGEQLGSGCFGSVNRGKWRNTPVAVKVMKCGTMSEESFVEEAKTMTQLNHPNLVQLYGVVTKAKPIMIVVELMRFGALNNYLARHKNRLLQQPMTLLEFCIQVCKGMCYLEQRKFIHRDLAARNCLVGQDHVVKVADFGLARYVIDDEYTSSAGTKFPVKWAPPEVLSYTRFSSKSDVWAFGVLMWEVFSGGEMPYSGMKNLDVVDYVITSNRRLQKPMMCPELMFKVMMHCWEAKPERRPGFPDLHQRLSGLADGGDYPLV